MDRTLATVNLMLEVANAIERYPEKYDQETWGGIRAEELEDFEDES